MIKIPQISFHIYGLLLGLGMWLALEASLWLSKKEGVKRQIIEGAWLWAIIPGILGARIYHVIDLWNEIYRFEPIRSLAIWEGGLGIYGGLIGGIFGLFLYWQSIKREIRLLRLLDIAMFGVPLAQAIGRWGNFANGELYGKPTNLPWGIYVSNIDTRVHPLFLYESLLDLSLFLVLLTNVKKRKLREGWILASYLVGYGWIRFGLEFLRPKEVVWTLGRFPVAQIFSLLAIGVGLAVGNGWWKRIYRGSLASTRGRT